MSKKKNSKNFKSSDLNDFLGNKKEKSIKKKVKLDKTKIMKEKSVLPKKEQHEDVDNNLTLIKKSEFPKNIEYESEIGGKGKFNIPDTKIHSKKLSLKENTPYLLLTTHYNPNTNKATLGFYDKEKDLIVQFDDHTNHRPYFIVKHVPEATKKFLESHPEYSKYKNLIIKIEEITIVDRLFLKEIKASKIYTQTPGDVPKIRNIFKMLDIETFESDIRYHLNYI